MNDKKRADFEKWAKGKECNTERHNDINQELLDWYAYDSTDFAWQAWQAAIASVVVEIPKTGLGFEDIFYMSGDQVVSALDKAGIRYE